MLGVNGNSRRGPSARKAGRSRRAVGSHWAPGRPRCPSRVAHVENERHPASPRIVAPPRLHRMRLVSSDFTTSAAAPRARRRGARPGDRRARPPGKAAPDAASVRNHVLQTHDGQVFSPHRHERSLAHHHPQVRGAGLEGLRHEFERDDVLLLAHAHDHAVQDGERERELDRDGRSLAADRRHGDIAAQGGDVAAHHVHAHASPRDLGDRLRRRDPASNRAPRRRTGIESETAIPSSRALARMRSRSSPQPSPLDDHAAAAVRGACPPCPPACRPPAAPPAPMPVDRVSPRG
jgi:hypothetical protein